VHFVEEGRARKPEGFVRSLVLVRDRVPSFEAYPFSIPAVRNLEKLDLHPEMTILVGENGSGKSTLIEAIAVAAGFNAEGGSKNFNFATRRSESELHRCLRLVRGARREKTGFFLRAESFFNVATQVDELGLRAYGGWGDRSLHEQSHGESFFTLVMERFGTNGLYVLDEPESALSPARQIALLARMRELILQGSQFVMATHSPILMAYPGASILQLDGDGLTPLRYDETEHYQVMRAFLLDPAGFVRKLFDEVRREREVRSTRSRR
jgi:predicted ATPase